jgi:hypothetical protein
MRTFSLTSSAKITAIAFSALAAMSCDAVQPTPACRVRPSKYAARFDLQGKTSGMCDGKVPTAEIINLNYFRDSKDYAEGAPSVGIVSDTIPEAVGEKTDVGMEYSLGQFSTPRPGDDDMCKAPTLSETKVKTDMADLTYKWSNFRVLVTPLSAAIYFGADLEKKDGDCTATYKVSAIYPVVHCGDATKPDLDDDGNPKKDEMGNVIMVPDPEHGKPNEEACKPVQGSGLSPDLEYKCDATPDGMSGTHACIPVQDFPNFKK